MKQPKIAKNIPIPESNSRRAHPFDRMDVGDSVFYADQTTKGSAYLAAMQYGHRTGRKFTGRTIDGGLRIWRIK